MPIAQITTPIATLAFEHIFVARPVVQGGEPRHSITMLFSPANQATAAYGNLKTGAAAAIDAMFGAGKSRDRAFMQSIRNPFKDAAEKSKYPGFEAGWTFITPWSKTAPGVCSGDLMDITNPKDVWAGQLVRATVVPFAYNQGGNKGVNFMLNNIQIVAMDRPRMDGRVKASGAFDAVDEEGNELAAGAAAAAPGMDAFF